MTDSLWNVFGFLFTCVMALIVLVWILGPPQD